MACKKPYTRHKRRRRAIALVFSLFIFLVASIPLTDAEAYVSVRTDRPRLLIDGNDVTRIRGSISTYNKTDFEALVQYVDYQISKVSPETIVTSSSTHILMRIRSASFVGLITEDQKYIQASISWAIAVAAVNASSGDDRIQGSRLMGMAFVYDWLFQYLTAEQKTILEQGIINHIIQLLPYIENPLFTGGHSRGRSVNIMTGLIVLEDSTTGIDRQALLTKIKYIWEKGYNRFQYYAGQDGGYYMGWKYGGAYTSPMPYFIWEKAVGVNWLNGPRSNQWLFYLYGTRGDGTMPRFGDYGDAKFDQYTVETIAVSAGKYKKPYAEWFHQTYLKTAWAPLNLLRIILKNPLIGARAPDDPTRPLPLSKFFRNSGIVIARDSWGLETTLLVFKSSSFNTINHHHRDQNHFTISFKGSLLIDSGFYDKYASSHWKNYFTRSIAHNTMVAYDPDETFYYYTEPISNDGGQFIPSPEPKTYQEVLNTKYQIKGVQGFGLTGGVSWVKGDASAAYNPDKVETFTRDLLYVDRPSGRKRPLVLILDQVALKKELNPTILFHSLGQPAVSGNFFAMNNANGGILYGMVLKPMLPSITAVGGPGKEFWVNGQNYPTSKAPTNGYIDAGTYRVEVTTKNPTQTATFLTLLAVDDAGDSDGMVSGALIDVDGYTGVRVGNDIYLIAQPVDGQIVSQIALTSEQANGVERIIVSGIGSTDLVQVNIADQPFENVLFVKNTL